MKKLISLLFVAILLTPIGASALSSEQKRTIQSGVYYFNTEEDISCQASGGLGPADLKGNDNLEKIYRFFVQKGLNEMQAAGVAGNAKAESSTNPLSESANYKGIFQWDKKVRWPRLEQWAATKGLNPLDLGTQLEFSWEEATQRGNIDGLKSQGTSVELSAWYWGRFFEVAIIGGSTSTVPLTNVQILDRRIKYSHEAYSLYGGTGGTTATTPAGLITGCTGAGQDTKFIDGFTFYSQYDAQWKNLPYGNSTIAEAGCGPAAMAMIITNLTGSPVTPVITASYAAQKNLFIPEGGSSASIAPVLAEHWGLKSEPLAAGITQITAALQAGKLVIVGGKGAVPFTSEGHYIVIRAVTADGKWKIGDSAFGLPEHKTANEQSWDPQQIITNVVGGTVYAIYK